MIVEIQVLPNPPGTDEDHYRHVEAAIAVIEQSGLEYEVGALGTTLEGDPDALWTTLRRAHDACLAAGADSVVTNVKLAQAADEDSGPSISSLTSKFRTS